jgi:hypothetical protein
MFLDVASAINVKLKPVGHLHKERFKFGTKPVKPDNCKTVLITPYLFEQMLTYQVSFSIITL